MVDFLRPVTYISPKHSSHTFAIYLIGLIMECLWSFKLKVYSRKVSTYWQTCMVGYDVQNLLNQFNMSSSSWSQGTSFVKSSQSLKFSFCLIKYSSSYSLCTCTISESEWPRRQPRVRLVEFFYYWKYPAFLRVK